MYCKSGTVATVVYIKGASATAESNQVIFVLGSKNPDVVNDTDASKYYDYKAVVDGEITTIALDEHLNGVDTVFSSVVTDEYDVVDVSESEKYTTDTTEDDYLVSGTAGSDIDDDVVTINGVVYAVSNDMDIFQVVLKTSGATDKFKVGSEGDVENGVSVKAIVSDGEIIALFYYAK